MKTLVKNYTFNNLTKQITITNLSNILLEQILLITNTTNNTIIYNFANPDLGATVLNNVITLDYDTTLMDSNDRLQIFIDIENYKDLEILGDIMIGGFASIVSQLESMKTAQGLPDTAGRLRVNVETGGTISTVSTVSTVSNISTMDGYNQRMMLFHLSNGAVNPLRDKIKVYSGMI
jgi:hypothetical protein